MISKYFQGRFAVTANVNHGGKICSVKMFDKADSEGDEASKREFKNLKTLRHEKMVRYKTLQVVTPLHLFFFLLQVSLLEAYETDKMCMLKFDSLPGTDVVTYLGERPMYSEQMVYRYRYIPLHGYRCNAVTGCRYHPTNSRRP